MNLKDYELLEIRGGAFGLKTAIWLGIGGILTLIVGIIDGYLNPLKCNMRK